MSGSRARARRAREALQTLGRKRAAACALGLMALDVATGVMQLWSSTAGRVLMGAIGIALLLAAFPAAINALGTQQSTRDITMIVGALVAQAFVTSAVLTAAIVPGNPLGSDRAAENASAASAGPTRCNTVVTSWIAPAASAAALATGAIPSTFVMKVEVSSGTNPDLSPNPAPSHGPSTSSSVTAPTTSPVSGDDGAPAASPTQSMTTSAHAPSNSTSGKAGAAPAGSAATPGAVAATVSTPKPRPTEPVLPPDTGGVQAPPASSSPVPLQSATAVGAATASATPGEDISTTNTSASQGSRASVTSTTTITKTVSER